MRPRLSQRSCLWGSVSGLVLVLVVVSAVPPYGGVIYLPGEGPPATTYGMSERMAVGPEPAYVPTYDHHFPHHRHHHPDQFQPNYHGHHQTSHHQVLPPPPVYPPDFAHRHQLHQSPPVPHQPVPQPNPSRSSTGETAETTPEPDKIYFPGEVENAEQTASSVNEDRMMVRVPLRGCPNGQIVDKWGNCRQPIFYG